MQLYIQDRSESTIATIGDFYEDTHKMLTASGTGSYEFTVSKSEPGQEFLNVGNYVVLLDEQNKGHQFTITKVDQLHDEKTVYAEDASLQLLSKEARPWAKVAKAQPASYYFNKALEGTGWVIGINQIENLTRTLEWTGWDTVLTRLLSIATEFDNAELDFHVELDRTNVVRKVVDIYKQVGAYRDDIQLVYGDTVSDIQKTESTENFATAIEGIGSLVENTKEGEPEKHYDFSAIGYDDGDLYSPKGDPKLYSRKAHEKWDGKYGYSERHFEYETKDPQELLNRSKTDLKKRCEPEVNYEISIADGRLIDINKGDTVKIFDHTYNPELLLQARAVEVDKSYTNPSQNKAIFGNFLTLISNADPRILAIQKMLNTVQQSQASTRADLGVVRQTATEAKNTATEAQSTAKQAVTKTSELDIALNQAKKDVEAVRTAVGAQDEEIANAVAGANGAVAKADKAVEDANKAVEDAGFSKDTAEQARKDANDAVKKANKAVEDAGFSKDTASQATKDATEAKAQASEAQATANKSISQAGDALTKADSAIDNASDALEKFNNLSVGGRNLIARTDELVGQMIGTDGKIAPLGGSSVTSAIITVTPDEPLTMSGTAGGDNTFRYAFYDETGNTIIRSYVYLRPAKTVKAPTGAKTFRISYPTEAQVKLERGNIATDWSPNPEDIQQQFTNINGELKSKVSQNTYDTLAGKVTSVATTASQNKNEIATLATKKVVDTLTKTVTDTSTLATQNAEAIKLKADGSTVDTLSGNITELSGQLELTNTALNAKITSNEVNNMLGDYATQNWTTGQITAKADSINLGVESVKQTVDSLQIGSTNLVQDSGFESGNLRGLPELYTDDTGKRPLPRGKYSAYIYFSSQAVKEDHIVYWYLPERITLKAGKPYTMSYDYSSAGSAKWASDYGLDADGNHIFGMMMESQAHLPDQSAWKRYKRTFTLEKDTVLKALRFGFISDSATKGWKTVDNIQIEEGTVAHPYSPSIKDLATTDWAKAQLSITDSKINSSVATINGNLSTLRSDLTQTSDSLKSTIKTVDKNTTNYSSLEQKLNGFQTTVANKADKSQITQLSNQLTSKIEQVGAPNLVPETFVNGNGTGTLTQVTHQFYQGSRILYQINNSTTTESTAQSKRFSVKPSTAYTLSFQAFAGSNVSSSDVWVLCAGADGSSSNNILAIEKKIFSPSHSEYTTVQIITGPNDHSALVRFDHNGSTYGRPAGLYFTEVQVEEGTVATPYRTAEAQLSSQITQLTDKINSSVATINGNLSTLRSDLTQTSDSLKSTISKVDKNATNYSSLEQKLNGFQTTVQGKADKSQLTQLSGQLTSTIAGKADKSQLTQLSGQLTSTIAGKADKSQITQLSDDINLRVQKGDVINQINISPESILIAGKKVHITGETNIDNAVIKSAMIESISADKIAAGTITGLTINGSTINAGKIYGDTSLNLKGSTYTVVLSSAYGMSITGNGGGGTRLTDNLVKVDYVSLSGGATIRYVAGKGVYAYYDGADHLLG